jgi:hypothetical protein
MNKNNHYGREGVHNYKLNNCVAYVYIVQQSLNEYLFVHSHIVVRVYCIAPPPSKDYKE